MTQHSMRERSEPSFVNEVSQFRERSEPITEHSE